MSRLQSLTVIGAVTAHTDCVALLLRVSEGHWVRSGHWSGHSRSLVKLQPCWLNSTGAYAAQNATALVQ